MQHHNSKRCLLSCIYKSGKGKVRKGRFIWLLLRVCHPPLLPRHFAAALDEFRRESKLTVLPSRQAEPPRLNVEKHFASIQRALDSLRVAGERDKATVVYRNLSPSSVSSKQRNTRGLVGVGNVRAHRRFPRSAQSRPHERAQRCHLPL